MDSDQDSPGRLDVLWFALGVVYQKQKPKQSTHDSQENQGRLGSLFGLLWLSPACSYPLNSGAFGRLSLTSHQGLKR